MTLKFRELTKAERHACRQWAVAQGLVATDQRGWLAQSVIDAWLEATPDVATAERPPAEEPKPCHRRPKKNKVADLTLVPAEEPEPEAWSLALIIPGADPEVVEAISQHLVEALYAAFEAGRLAGHSEFAGVIKDAIASAEAAE